MRGSAYAPAAVAPDSAQGLDRRAAQWPLDGRWGPLLTKVFWQHLRTLLLEQLRNPLTVASNLLMPALGFLACVVLVPELLGPRWGAVTLAQFWVLGALSNGLFTTSMTVAQDRDTAWGSYLSTLPSSPLVREVALGVTVLLMEAVAAVAVLVVALPLLERPPAPGRLLAGFGWLLLTVVPFALLGFWLGRLLRLRAVLPVAQAVFLAGAFGGGLLLPATLVHRFDAWAMPTTAAVELVRAQFETGLPGWTAPAALSAWALGAAALVVVTRTRSASRS